jgi:hypothetical protein
MIKQLLLTVIIFISIFSSASAQDTTAYEIQRQKINGLLAERSAKFGQYDQSLNERTGIFGFQTKRDIKNSNEILRQIALTDNDIFSELKILLDYKDLQVQEVKSTITNTTESIQNYRRTIKNLQDQNQQINAALLEEEKAKNTTQLLMFVFLLGCAALGFFVYQQHQRIKAFEKVKLGK